MSDLELIVQKVRALSFEDTRLVSRAVLEHLEELDDVEAYDEAKAKAEPSESFESYQAGKVGASARRITESSTISTTI